ncbi:PadR family transcriptional regulator [Nonomuraea rosea]|uniref:PadR family transcriptional regulator n=1 Tax=Nonomuraea rosea TaxID=638574 RepID=UPI003CD07965
MCYQVRSELQSWRAEIWAKIKPGSIYHALKKAAADGLLTEHAEPGNSGPERVLYRATARGRDEISRTGPRRSAAHPRPGHARRGHRHVAHADQDRCHRAH